jgi:diacylglycerol kinase family enzyme
MVCTFMRPEPFVRQGILVGNFPFLKYNHCGCFVGVFMPRGILAYNPAAGRFPSRILAERAAAVLRSSGWDIHLEQTENSEHIVKMAQESAKLGLEAFFIVGGDGSLNQACRGLIGTEVALGVLPAGTANVWAQEIGLPGLTWTRWMALEESARRLAKGQIRTIDLGLCNGNPFLLWGGIGLDAFIVHRIEPRTPGRSIFCRPLHCLRAWHASFGGV